MTWTVNYKLYVNSSPSFSTVNCVCVYVRERERERDRQTDRAREGKTIIWHTNIKNCIFLMESPSTFTKDDAFFSLKMLLVLKFTLVSYTHICFLFLTLHDLCYLHYSFNACITLYVRHFSYKQHMILISLLFNTILKIFN